MTFQIHDTSHDTERVYRFIVAFIGDNGEPPRKLDIIEGLDLTPYHLDVAIIRLRGARRISEHSALPTIHLELPPAA